MERRVAARCRFLNKKKNTKMEKCADDVRLAYPLFQGESGGSNPTSALQLYVRKIDKKHGYSLNKKWHSRLPVLENYQTCEWYAAEYDGIIYAVACWGHPLARKLNGRNWYELRRMAISPESPHNTASRFLSIMVKILKREHPEIVKLISYQDTEVHRGIIYRASNWQPVTCYLSGDNWNNEKRFKDGCLQDGPLGLKKATPKIRWEYDL